MVAFTLESCQELEIVGFYALLMAFRIVPNHFYRLSLQCFWLTLAFILLAGGSKTKILEWRDV